MWNDNQSQAEVLFLSRKFTIHDKFIRSSVSIRMWSSEVYEFLILRHHKYVVHYPILIPPIFAVARLMSSANFRIVNLFELISTNKKIVSTLRDQNVFGEIRQIMHHNYVPKLATLKAQNSHLILIKSNFFLFVNLLKNCRWFISICLFRRWRPSVNRQANAHFTYDLVKGYSQSHQVFGDLC